MNSLERKPMVVEVVVDQHAAESAFLWILRNRLVAAPHMTLRSLARHDERVAAHLDGLRLAGDAGMSRCEALLLAGQEDALFPLAVLTAESGDMISMSRLLGLAESVPSMEHPLTCALGWASPTHLRGTVRALLASDAAFHRRVGITVCMMHGVSPGKAHEDALRSDDASLRSVALQAAGELGRLDFVSACDGCLQDEDATCRFQAARSCALLGERTRAIEVAALLAVHAGPFMERARVLAFVSAPLAVAHEMLRALASDGRRARSVVEGAGIAGDPVYVPWLLRQMEAPVMARLAAQAFSTITGVDLAATRMRAQEPPTTEQKPDDDPDDADVKIDLDADLPWPDPERIAGWWEAHRHEYRPGEQYFMGKPLHPEHCASVLATGFQMQRRTAAFRFSMLAPGTRLFPTGAPAWRQERLLRDRS